MRDGTKHVSEYLKDHNMKIDSSSIGDMIELICESRIVREVDILDSILLCLNYYYLHPKFWTEVSTKQMTYKPFKGGSGTLTFNDLFLEWVKLAPPQDDLQNWTPVGIEVPTGEEIHKEFWDYVISKRPTSGRNDLAHPSSNLL